MGSAQQPQEIARGMVDNMTVMRLYSDCSYSLGTFRDGGLRFGLIAFDVDSDAMRRKSLTGRGAAALATGGLSVLAANNNRGVLYVTVSGEMNAFKTFTTRNPSNTLLSDVRTLQAAADRLLAEQERKKAPPVAAAATSIASELQQLAQLHQAGALTDAEFAAAKARLIG